jgi:hypothetical protein
VTRSGFVHVHWHAVLPVAIRTNTDVASLVMFPNDAPPPPPIFLPRASSCSWSQRRALKWPTSASFTTGAS